MSLRGGPYYLIQHSDAATTLLRPLAAEFSLLTKPGRRFAAVSGYGAIDATDKTIYLNPAAPGRLGYDEWAYILGHLLAHLGLDHHHAADDWATQLAQEVVADNLVSALGVSRMPEGYRRLELAGDDVERLAGQLRARDPRPASVGLAGSVRDHVRAPDAPSFAERLGEGLDALLRQRIDEMRDRSGAREDIAELARRTIINRYPLLAAMASRIKIITDPRILAREGVELAAVNSTLGEVYLNVSYDTTEREAIYLLAHELLHLGLRHGDRIGARDPYIWNLSCDFVIAGWLAEMAVGVMPQKGALYDPTLSGMSAEAIYDLLAGDPARRRRLRSFRGVGLGDMILAGPRTLVRGDVANLDDAYAMALRYGLDACRLRYGSGRGTVPAELEEEIDSLSVKPIEWDVELAHWFEEHVRLAEPVRTYARASRRQSASPDIARPAWYLPQRIARLATFGIILDTSGSMDRQLLARALGSIVSYAQSRGVAMVRLVHCDAQPYDEGYVDIEQLRAAYTVKGRGGTILQPAADYLLAQSDFPASAPVLVLTDGMFETGLRIDREHAFVLPVSSFSALPSDQYDARVFRVL